MRDHRLGFGTLFRDGATRVRAYWRVLLCVYLVQLAIATGAAMVMSSMLSTAFAYSPAFDDAVDGDAFALAMSFIRHSDLFIHLMWVGVGTLALYAVVSWYLTGGVLAVFIEHPSSGAAATFGAGGARTFFAFARLAAWCIIPYGIAFIAMAMGLAGAGDGLDEALTLGQAAGALAAGLAPGAVVFGLSFCAVDYARADLARHPEQSSLRALLRGYRMLVAGWMPLAHLACYYAVITGVSALYVLGTFDRPIGVFALLLVRQLVSLLRFTAKIVLLAGQVTIAGQMAPPRVRQRRRQRRAQVAEGT